MPQLSRLAAAVVVALAAGATVQAQQVRSVQPAARVAPSASTRSALAAPSPSGLRPVFPAGLSSGSGALQTTDPVAATSAPLTIGPGTGTAPTITGSSSGGFNGTVNGAGVVTPDAAFTANGTSPGPSDVNTGITYNAGSATTATMGAGGAPGYGLARGPAQSVPTGGAGFSAVDIARSFITADANRDGELTRSEARRLSISMSSFEEMDRNYDGVVSRGEYEDGLR